MPSRCALLHRLGRARARVRLLGWLAVTGLVSGVIVGAVRGASLGPSSLVIGILKGSVLGTSVAVILGGLEQILLRRLWRRLPLGGAILVRTAVYAPLTAGIYLAVSASFSPWMPWNLQRSMLLPTLGIAVVSVLIWSAVIGVARLLGFRVIRNLLSGRYHRPFEEGRIFLFLDLVGSTTIAERIGHLRYHAFLRDFIADLEDPLLEHGADVYQYVGDEVVVTWPLADARSNGRCLACYFAIVDTMMRSRGRYERAYGAAPSFRTGVHAGRVVAGEIGDWRKQIVFVGDVVNTAPRAQAEAKAREKDLVVTDDFLACVDLPAGVEARSLGAVRPKGKERAVELFEITRKAPL